MSRDDFHQAANCDVPRNVAVPNTMSALIIWAAGRWGIGIVFAAATAFVYVDLKEERKTTLDLLEKTHAIIIDSASANRELARAVQALTDEAKDAHRQPQ